MIEILTLTLGLMVGSMPFELRVEPQVERVEVRIDGELRVELDGPPWRFEVDWGEDILPRTLDVIAYGANGDELGRDRRWINLRTSESVARLVFAPAGKDGRIPHFAVRWASIGIDRPLYVAASFDDQPLTAPSVTKIPLPEYDPETIHWLSVEVDFGVKGKEMLGARLGGSNLIEMSSELTAVAVDLKSRRAASRLQGSVLVEGEVAEIHGIEKGPAEVLMVVDRRARSHLLLLSNWIVVNANLKTGISRQGDQLGKRRRNFDVTDKILAPKERIPAIAELGRLDDKTQLSFIWPRAASWSGPSLAPSLFPSSPARALGEAGLVPATEPRDPPPAESQVASAVAIAGLAASSASCRRAVVLIAEDLSDGDAEQVRRVVRYLQALRVPLYVWTVGTEADPGAWPASRHLGGPDKPSRLQASLGDALDDLRDDLDRQRIVWLEGGWLPQSVSLEGSAKGVSWPGG